MKFLVRPDRTDFSRMPTGPDIILNHKRRRLFLESGKEYIGKLSKHFPKIMRKFLFFKHQIFSWKFFKILTVSNSFHLRYAIICQGISSAGFRLKSGRIPDRTVSEIRPHTGPDLMSGAALLSSIVFSINSQPFIILDVVECTI